MDFKSLLNIHGKLDWRQLNSSTLATGLCFDSRKVREGDVYVAIRGNSGDGHDYLKEVCEKASAVVVEDAGLVPSSFQGAVVEVLDSRLSLQILSQRFFDNPGDQLASFAVTGTNGKTSTAYILESLLNSYGGKCGVIGTIDHHVGEKVWKTELTSPDPVTLQGRLQEFVDEGADSFVIEASSHALHQSRIHQGIDVCIFTNLSRDHLDYHSDLESYFQAKALLFNQEMVKPGKDGFAAINGDDPWGEKLAQMTNGRTVFRFGQKEGSDFLFKVIHQGLDGTEFQLTLPQGQDLAFKTTLIGLHNVYNIVSALVGLYSLNYDLTRAVSYLPKFTGVPGRLQSVPSSKKVYAFVDYAHTPEALEKVLTSLKKYVSQDQKLICVFGCGGDRDKGKRPLMGQVAEKHSHQVIVTSDNPRTEDPTAIIDDILQGFEDKSKHKVEADRAAAIKMAVEMASEGDVILVAGKGHEDYQIIGHKRNHFSDFEQLQSVLK